MATLNTYPDNISVEEAIQTRMVADLTAINNEVAAATAGSGVLVSSNDSTVGYLNGKLVAGEGISLTEGTDGGDETLTIANTGLGLPKNYLTGLTLSNDTDTDHDIAIAAGECRDAADSADMALSAVLTKQIDAAWAVGDDAGGMFTGTVANSTWYHVFLIKKDSDGTIDAGFDTSITAANIPAGYTAYRRRGSVKTDGSANILGFVNYGKWFEWKAKPQDLGAPLGTTPTNYTVSVPLGVNVLARINQLSYQNGHRIYIYSPLITDQTCDVNAGRATSVSNIVDNHDGANQFDVLTNTSSQVRAVGAAADQSLNAITVGWTEL